MLIAHAFDAVRFYSVSLALDNPLAKPRMKREGILMDYRLRVGEGSGICVDWSIKFCV